MRRFLLSHDQAYSFVSGNSYTPSSAQKLLSRDIEGRYQNAPDMPAVTIPGGDIGEMAILLAASNIYGFHVDPELAFNIFVETVGIENLSLTSPTSKQKTTYYEQLLGNFKEYNLDEDQIQLIEKLRKDVVKKGAKEVTFETESTEGALFMLKGNKSLYPQYELEIEDRNMRVSAYSFHAGLINERHAEIVKKLLEKNAVTLYDRLDENYLIEVLSVTAEDHLFETMKRIAQGVPIFEVIFKDDNTFTFTDLGFVE